MGLSMKSPVETKREPNDRSEDEAFLRRFVVPEEDRSRFTSAKWTETGGYRWFRSPNVVCIEHYRKKTPGRCPAA
jgi:hypothetical protein